MYWYEYTGPQKDIFVSSRIRLARNIVDYPFGDKLDKTGAYEIAERVRGALSEDEGYTFTEFSALAENEKQSLVEKKLASLEMLEKKQYSAVVENKEKGICVLVGEEDHIRIQAIGSGFCLDSMLSAAFEAEELIDKKEKLAFSPKLGYLTHCPTNLGTGMRASVMMFLPMLTLTGSLKRLESSLQKIGLTMRGTGGEGSAVRGCLYQISNRVTLGVSEEEIVENLKEAALSLAKEERRLREDFKSRGSIALEDRIMRSLGTMKYARSVDTEELYRLYSDVRLGISLGIIEGEEGAIDRLLTECQPATLCLLAEKELSFAERDIQRAKKLREY